MPIVTIGFPDEWLHQSLWAIAVQHPSVGVSTSGTMRDWSPTDRLRVRLTLV